MNERAAVEWRAAEVRRLEELLRAADAATNSHHVARVHVHALTVKCHFLNTGPERASAKHNALDDCNCELEVDAGSGDSELDFGVPRVRSLRNCIDIDETRAISAELQVCERLENL